MTGQGYDFYIIKLNSGLAVQWQQTYNGAASLDDKATSIDIDASGNLFVSGYSTTSTQGRNFITQKYNSSGTLQWTQAVDQNSGDDEANGLVVDASNNVTVAGFTASDINGADYYCVKYDNSGTKLWDIQSDFIHRDDMATAMALDTAGNVVLTGQTQTAPGIYKYYTVKYAEKDVITPTDFNGEVPQGNFLYYENKGQIVDTAFAAVSSVKYYTNFCSPAFYVKKNSLSFVFSRIDTIASTADTLHRIDLGYNSANSAAQTYPLNQQKSYHNYFLGYTSGPITGVFGNQRLVTKDLYTNIDLVHCSNQNGIKLYYIVKPGGDMRDIQMEFTGATSFSLNGSNNALSINSSLGSLTFDRPTVYQLTSANATVAVTGWTADWQTNGASNKYKFNTGAYTSSLTLVIEVDEGNAAYSPASTYNLKWSTYLGASNNDDMNDIRTDAANNLFGIGESDHNYFPGTTGQYYQTQIKAGTDGIISKFDSGDQLIWSTYIGGTRTEQLAGIDFAPNGDIYCVGTTNSGDLARVSKSGATNGNAFAGPYASGQWETDGFVFELKQDGLTNPWLAYYGGNKFDYFTGCKFDGSGNLFVIGYSASTDISNVTPTGAYNHPFTNSSGAGGDVIYDGIIVKYNQNSSVAWSTFIGSTNTTPPFYPYDYLNDLDFVNGSELVVVGYSQGDDYPVVYGGVNYHNSTGNNAVITRFSNNGNLEWSTYYDGGQADQAFSVLSRNGLLYVAGKVFYGGGAIHTVSSSHYYYQGTKSGNTDGFFLVFDEDNALFHASYIGGSGDDEVWDMAMDSHNILYMTGLTSSTDFPAPAVNPANTYHAANNGNYDNFICSLQGNGIGWLTYLGGAQGEGGGMSLFGSTTSLGKPASIAVNGNNNLFLGGRTTSTAAQSFPTDPEGGPPVFFQGSLAGPLDGSITKFDLAPVQLVGIQQSQPDADGILLYPNPAASSITVQLGDMSESVYYKIYDALGRISSSGNCPGRLTTISVSSLSNGIYFLELYNVKATYSAKFIKHD